MRNKGWTLPIMVHCEAATAEGDRSFTPWRTLGATQDTHLRVTLTAGRGSWGVGTLNLVGHWLTPALRVY